MITGIILCGGEGSRIQHLTDLPKCVIPYQGKPIIKHILKQFYQSGVVSRIILLAADKRDAIIDAVWPKEGFRRILSDTYLTVITPQATHIFPYDEPKIGTLAALRYARPFVNTGKCMIVNGDTIVNYPFDQLLDEHYNSRSDITVAVVDRSTENTADFVDSGVWVVNSAILDQMGGRYKLRESWLRSATSRIKVGNYQVDTFIDIGTPETFETHCGGILNGRG